MGEKISELISGVRLTKISKFCTPEGDVLRGLRTDDQGFDEFAEAYFSFIKFGVFKGWKRHQKATLNLLVPIGVIDFCLFDDRASSSTFGIKQRIRLSKENYCRLTVPPLIWVAFTGLSRKENMLLNISNVLHDPAEADRKPIDHFDF